MNRHDGESGLGHTGYVILRSDDSTSTLTLGASYMMMVTAPMRMMMADDDDGAVALHIKSQASVDDPSTELLWRL